MSVKYIFSTFLLLFIVALLGVKNYEVWTQPVELAAENELTRKQRKDPQAAPIVMGSQIEKNSIASYIFIAEKNIFNPERKDFPVTPVEQSKPRVRPQVILYGVTIAGDYQAASVTIPGRPLGKGERETTTLKMGEKIGEYKLARIQPDRITVESNGDSFEVLLYDSRNPKKRMQVTTETKPPVVAGPSPVTPPIPSPPPGGGIPGTPPPQTMLEKPKEPPQQQVSPAPPSTRQRLYPPGFHRRTGGSYYIPPAPPANAPGK